jgi:hypothetical protein
MIGTSRGFHAYRAHAHLPGSLMPIPRANHFTILDDFRDPASILTRAVLQLREDIQ